MLRTASQGLCKQWRASWHWPAPFAKTAENEQAKTTSVNCASAVTWTRRAFNGEHLRDGTSRHVPCSHTWKSAPVPDSGCHDGRRLCWTTDHTQSVQPCQQHAQPDARSNDPHVCPNVNGKYGATAASPATAATPPTAAPDAPTAAAATAAAATTDARLWRIHNPTQVMLRVDLM